MMAHRTQQQQQQKEQQLLLVYMVRIGLDFE